MKLDLLAIAAHPDDVELTCGGTLLKMAQRGYKTGILDLTAGEMGTQHLSFRGVTSLRVDIVHEQHHRPKIMPQQRTIEIALAVASGRCL